MKNTYRVQVQKSYSKTSKCKECCCLFQWCLFGEPSDWLINLDKSDWAFLRWLFWRVYKFSHFRREYQTLYSFKISPMKLNIMRKRTLYLYCIINAQIQGVPQIRYQSKRFSIVSVSLPCLRKIRFYFLIFHERIYLHDYGAFKYFPKSRKFVHLLYEMFYRLRYLLFLYSNSFNFEHV